MIIGNWGEGFYFEMGIKYRIVNGLLVISFYWLIFIKIFKRMVFYLLFLLV